LEQLDELNEERMMIDGHGMNPLKVLAMVKSMAQCSQNSFGGLRAHHA